MQMSDRMRRWRTLTGLGALACALVACAPMPVAETAAPEAAAAMPIEPRNACELAQQRGAPSSGFARRRLASHSSHRPRPDSRLNRFATVQAGAGPTAQSCQSPGRARARERPAGPGLLVRPALSWPTHGQWRNLQPPGPHGCTPHAAVWHPGVCAKLTYRPRCGGAHQ